MKRLTLVLGPIALAAVLAACSGASAAPAGTPAAPASAGSQVPAGGTATVVAKDIAFTTPAVAVTAGSPFTIAFDNRDGAPHNIDISDASGAHVFKGEIVSGTQVSYAVPALAVGTYTFICDVHPDMKGTITAK
ncbi:MAG: cupredoxin domain-containing protein [Chloroflexota bacterium]